MRFFEKGGFDEQLFDEFRPLDKHYWRSPADFAELISQLPDLENIKKQVKLKSEKFGTRDLLLRILQRQYREFDPSWTERLLRPLASGNCFTITCAHQGVLFGGALYWWYKIAHTIALCRAASKAYPDYVFVPVYYCGTEDHDLAEVASISLFNKRLTWDTDQQGPVGKMKPEAMKLVLEELQKLFGTNKDALERIRAIEDLLDGSTTQSDFYRKFVHHVFPDDGLVFFDPDDHEAKAAFAPFMTEEISRQWISHESYGSVKKLADLGYQPQAHVRAINLFYIREHYRNGIYSDGRFYHTKDLRYQWSADSIQEEIRSNPERFSPNVVLRPLFQEYMLPNLIFVAGGAEIAYWLQLKSAFDHAGVPYPIIWRRFSAIIFLPQVLEKLAKVGLTWSDVVFKVHEMQQHYMEKNSGLVSDVQKTHDQLELLLKNQHLNARRFNETFVSSIGAEIKKIEQQLEKIAQRIIREEKSMHTADLMKISKLRDVLFPEGNLQERYEPGIRYFLEYGPDFVKGLVDSAGPEDKMIALLLKEPLQNE